MEAEKLRERFGEEKEKERERRKRNKYKQNHAQI